MNSKHSKGEISGSLKEGLDQLGQAYGQLRQDEPPELLDQAILNRAHRAVEKKPYWMRFGWLHGMATTAVFVLAFFLVVKQTETPPVFETGADLNDAASLQRNKAAKVAPSNIKPAESLRVRADQKESKQQVLQSRPATTAGETQPFETVPGVSSQAPSAEATRASFVADSLHNKGKRLDADDEMSPLREEEIDGDATTLSSKTDFDAEERLLEIIKLKRSGDETWKTALASFRESYPDYTLPDELKD